MADSGRESMWEEHEGVPIPPFRYFVPVRRLAGLERSGYVRLSGTIDP